MRSVFHPVYTICIASQIALAPKPARYGWCAKLCSFPTLNQLCKWPDHLTPTELIDFKRKNHYLFKQQSEAHNTDNFESFTIMIVGVFCSYFVSCFVRKIHAFRVSIKQITINLLDVLSIAFNCHTEKCIDLSNLFTIGEFYLQCGQTHTHFFGAFPQLQQIDKLQA